MKKNKVWILIITLTFMLASCGMARNDAPEMESEEFRIMAAMPVEEPSARQEKLYDEDSSVSSDYAAASTDIERIVIKNANLSIAVEYPLEAGKAINTMAEEMGGFVVSTNSYKSTTSRGIEVSTATVTIRVPAEKLNEALNKIKALVEDPDLDILSEDVYGQDVTAEVTDLESRLRNLEAAEAQLLEIMESAYDTEDVITIFRELTNIREEIEVIQGQIKYYRESASLSAISIHIQAKAALEPISIGGWEPGLEAQKALQALVEGGKYLVNMLIWLVLFAVPVLAVITLPVYFVLKYFRKRSQKKETKKPEDKKK